VSTGLRWGIAVVVNDAPGASPPVPLSAGVLDAISEKTPGALTETEATILDAIRERSRMVIDSGVTISLTTFRTMSRYEMAVLEEAAERRRAIDRSQMAAAFGHPNPDAFLPNTDAEFVRRKAVAEHIALFERMTRGGSPNP
jgi:hypothetical protein